MQVSDGSNDGQSDAQSRHSSSLLVRCAVKKIEDLPLIFLGQSGTLIGEGYAKTFILDNSLEGNG